MATAETEEPVEREFEKEVVMVGYFDEQKTHMDRFKTLVTGIDLESTKTRRKEQWEFELDLSDAFDDNGAVFNWWVYAEEQKERALERLKERGFEDMVEVHHIIETDEETVNSEYTAKRKLLEELMENLPEELPPDLERATSGGKYRPVDSMASKINIRRPDFDKRRVLAKESERESDDLYETVADYPSVSFHITLNAGSRELIDLYTEEVIAELHKALSKRDGIGRVRYTSCTTREEKTGECYNI